MRYSATPTCADFLRANAQVKLICGPVGGGKSTAALMEALRRAMNQTPFEDGVRRTKCIILRNTLQQLKSTVKPLIDQWFTTIMGGTLGAWRVTDNVFHLRFAMGDGTTVDSEWWLMAADTPDDVRRLLSVEASWGWAEECREIDPEVFRGFRGRMNRYPNVAMGGITDPGVFCSTNPPPIGSYWHEMMTAPPEGWAVFMQPPAILDDGALNPAAENLENLAPGYYENLVSGASEDWIDVYLKNKFGLGNLGQPVFRSTFKKAFHVSKEPLRMVMQAVNPLLVGMDNGLTAAAVIGQMDARGRVNLLAECYVPPGESMGVEKFLDSKLIPLLRNRYPSVRHTSIVFVVDPACFQRSQVNEITIAQAINARGFRVVRASTNDPERRIAAVEQLLIRQIDGGPGFLIDPACQWIIDTLEWGYRFKRQASGQMTAAPDKNHHSHMADAIQYLSMHYNVQVDPASGIYRAKRKEVKPSNYVYA
jgi:hypothetical protein